MDEELGICMMIELKLIIYLMGASSRIYRQNNESRISKPPRTFSVTEVLDIQPSFRQ